MGMTPRLERDVQRLTQLEENLDETALDEFEAVLTAAEHLLGPDSMPPMSEITDFAAATAALESGWQSIRTAFADGAALAERVDCPDVDELMHRMIRNERIVRTAQVRQRDSVVRLVRETLADLRDVETVEGLITAGAEAVCRLGFDRSIVSRVENNTWMTEAVHLEGDSEWASEILNAGRAHPVTLVNGLPEDEARRRRKPILVTRVQEREAVHQAVAEASLSRSYVAAPIMPGNRLLGFVHGDRFFHRGEVTEFDAELIGVFSQAYSFALERAILGEELNALRETVRRIGAGLQACASDDTSPFDRAATSSTVPASWRPPPVLRTQQTQVGDIELTRREFDVFQLMAQGDTNHRIARRLSISEGTVKSHVKHILRKTGAANRAEAVARWHESRARA
ncbi:MAG: LuxR C-terminal-related transcriptional regulator [Propionibacteriales bacterium]|nr:LuxR C-terminal-related transcriptional regulator [Propionibacteriales bacterium]